MAAQRDANRAIAQYGGYVPERAVDPDQGRMPRSGGIVRSDGPVDLAGAADGQYPAAALDRPKIAAAVRRLVGPAVFAHLKSFSAGGPMRSIGDRPSASPVRRMRRVGGALCLLR